jgi:hypothetical protein
MTETRRPFPGDIDIVEVTDHRDLREFIRFPVRLHRHDPNWVPPLDNEVRKLLDRRHHPFFEHGEACLWLAKRGGETVGRISAQINRLHVELHHDPTGNFGFLDAIDDQAVFHALLTTAEVWLKSRSMTRILGPYNLSMNDEIGLLVQGFDTPPMVAMPHAPSYYAGRIDAEHYTKAKDLHAYLLDMANAPDLDSPRAQRAREKLSSRNAVTVRHIDMKHFAEEMRRGLDIYNDAWADNWGFLPVNEREATVLIKSINPIVDPGGIIFGLVDGEMVSIVVSIPNLNEIIADLDGRLLPFNWVKLLWRLKFRRPKSARVILAGVRTAYRHSPVSGALIAYSLQELLLHYKRVGVQHVEWSWILEDNQKSAAIRNIGATLSKVYRLYEKPL